ncbi:MAG: TlpA disulfide reductase family protein [Myxococcota bacterium]
MLLGRAFGTGLSLSHGKHLVLGPICSALVFSGLVLLAPGTAQAVNVGARAPEIGLEDFDGRPLRIRGYRGRRVVIVDFWATWCEPCRAELPALQRLYARYFRQGLRVVGVSVDSSEERARAFARDRGVLFRNAHDPERSVPARYGLGTMPTSYIIDHRGIVRHITAGYRGAADSRQMERVVVELLEELNAEAGPAEASSDDDSEPEALSGDSDAQDGTDGPEPVQSEVPPARRSDAGRSGGLCSAADGSSAPIVVYLTLAVWWGRRRWRWRTTGASPPRTRGQTR